jgi:caffeoyl-CoA O-methyltransferase
MSPHAVCAAAVVAVLGLTPAPGRSQGDAPTARDERVRAFLESRASDWRDMNVPVGDGQFLHDLIVERGYTRALEIGTSTGHSSIWIAWALSRTGGRLVTLEIDEGRQRQALENFAAAGVADLIDARLGDAHEIVKTIEGPFDFVFSDADKGWYTQCYVSHNIRMRGMRDYLDYLRSRPDFTTTIENERTTGISVTCRTAR